MPLAVFPVMLAIAVLVSLGSLVYLIVNARSVADLFRKTDIVPGPGRPRASRGAILAALVAFNLGWIASIGLYWFTWTGQANDVIESDPHRTAD
jgi:hypothetical protein